MPNVLLKMEGGKELQRELRRHAKRFDEAMAIAIPQEAEALQEGAKAATPVRKGQLISKLKVRHKREFGFTGAAVGYTAKYAAAVHEGIFGGRKARELPNSFHWYLKVYQAFEAGFSKRIVRALQSVAKGGSPTGYSAPPPKAARPSKFSRRMNRLKKRSAKIGRKVARISRKASKQAAKYAKKTARVSRKIARKAVVRSKKLFKRRGRK